MCVGDVLMTPPPAPFCAAGHGRRDVAVPQADNLGVLPCHCGMFSAKVTAGRAQAAYTSQWGRAAGISVATTLQENRSRGCRRAKWFSRWSWWPLLQAVPRSKKKSCMSMMRQSPLTSRTPANTSNRLGRANGGACPRPALILSGVRPFGRPVTGVSFDAGRWLRHHAPLGSTRGKTC